MARAASAMLAIIIALVVAPAVFGLYGMLQAVALVATPLLFLRLERAVLLAPDRAEVLEIARVCLRLVVPMAMVATVIAALAVPGLWQRSDSIPLLAVFLLGLVLKGLIVMANVGMQRFSLAVEQPLLILFQTAAQFLLQIGLMLILDNALLALLLGEVGGAMIALALLARRRDWRINAATAPANPRAIFANWRQFPLLNMPSALISQALVAAPLLLFGHLADAVSTGHFAFALRLADAPIQLIGAAAVTVAMTEGWQSRPRGGPREHRMMWLYLAVLVATCIAIATAAAILSHWSVNLRVDAVAALIPYALMVTAAVGLGAPIQDIAGFRRGEATLLVVHAVTFCATAITWMTSSNPLAAIMVLAALLLARSIAAIILAERPGR
jgi:hypothetical protein